MSSKLKKYGWNKHWEDQSQEYRELGLLPGRIMGQDRKSYLLVTAEGERAGVLTGKMRHKGNVRPAVGDWVAFSIDSDDGPVLIEAVLERRSRLARKEAGKRVREGLISASRSRKHHRTSEANEIGAFAMSVQGVQPKRLQFGGDVVPPPQPPYLAQVAENDACARSALTGGC